MTILHTLYVAAHAVGLATALRGRDIESSNGRSRRAPEQRACTAARDRLAVFEHRAGSVLRSENQFNDELPQSPNARPERVSDALSAWDVAAHRALTAQVQTADLLRIARTQVLILGAAGALLNAANVLGQIHPTEQYLRLTPALSAAQNQWMRIVGLWSDLTPPHARRGEAGLHAAALDTHGTLSAVLIRDRAVATPREIADRLDLSEVCRLAGHVSASNLDLAVASARAALDKGITAPARAVHALTDSIHTPRFAQVDTSPVSAWVSPKALMANAPAGLPDVIREHLGSEFRELTRLSNHLLSAGACLENSLGGPGVRSTAALNRVCKGTVDLPLQPMSPSLGCDR